MCSQIWYMYSDIFNVLKNHHNLKEKKAQIVNTGELPLYVKLYILQTTGSTQ